MLTPPAILIGHLTDRCTFWESGFSLFLQRGPKLSARRVQRTLGKPVDPARFPHNVSWFHCWLDYLSKRPTD